MTKVRTLRNRTITLDEDEKYIYANDLILITEPVELNSIENRNANQDIFQALDFLPQDFVFDPFSSVSSCLVAARKLDRKFFDVEIDEEYCLLAPKRLKLAELDKSIQGYKDGVFWERNIFFAHKQKKKQLM